MENKHLDISELKVDIDDAFNNSTSSSSKDNPSRTELLWESREEVLLKKWCDNMSKASELHKQASRKFKKRYTLLSIPTIVIPIFMSGLSSYLEDEQLTNSLLLITTSLFSGLNAFLNYGKRTQKHAEYSGKYDALAKDIQLVLSKPKANRVPCDIYLQKIYDNLTNLDLNAPDVKNSKVASI